MIKHELKIVSLHDAQAECSCGWNMTCTGEMTKEEIEASYETHIGEGPEVQDEDRNHVAHMIQENCREGTFVGEDGAKISWKVEIDVVEEKDGK